MINPISIVSDSFSASHLISASENFWMRFIEKMGREMPSSQFKTWIKPLAPMGLDGSNSYFVIAAPNQFKLDWIKKSI